METIVLNTYCPDRLISISTLGTFNLSIDALSLHFRFLWGTITTGSAQDRDINARSRYLSSEL